MAKSTKQSAVTTKKLAQLLDERFAAQETQIAALLEKYQRELAHTREMLASTERSNDALRASNRTLEQMYRRLMGKEKSRESTLKSALRTAS